MASVPAADSRFDEAEADVDHGAPWMYRDTGAPNPLTILATGWSTGVTKLGDAEFLCGVDRQGKKWSVLVGSLILTKRLIEGTVEEWDSDRGEFAVVDTLGRVQPGEIVSIKYLGDTEGAKYTYPNFRVSRKQSRSAQQTLEPADEVGAVASAAADDDIPF